MLLTTITLLTIGLISGTFTDIDLSFFQTQPALIPQRTSNKSSTQPKAFVN